MIFFHKSYFVSSSSISDNCLLGVLSSTLSRFVMNALNPGVNFEAGDGKRLPINQLISDNRQIKSLVGNGINQRKQLSSFLEYSSDFDGGFFYDKLSEEVSGGLLYEGMCRADIGVIYGLVDDIVFDEYDISTKSISRAYEDLPKNLANYPHISNAGDLDTEEHRFREEVETKTFSNGEYSQLVDSIETHSDDDLREISEALEVSPYTVAMVRHEHDLYTRDEKREAAGRLLSYYLGCIMGRWDLDRLAPDEDGIVVFDEGFDDNVGALVRECIELTYGEDELYERETEIKEMLNKDYTDWLRETFFRYHHCKEYRRRGQRIPIYWQLESDDGAFSCFLYYHAMDEDTLPKLRGQYLDVKIGRTENRLSTIEGQLPDAEGDRERELRREQEELSDELADLEGFGERLDVLIGEGFAPDFEAGIWQNIQRVDEYDLLAVPLDKL